MLPWFVWNGGIYKGLEIEAVISEIIWFAYKYSTYKHGLYQHTNMEMQQLQEETTQNQIRRLKRKIPQDLCK